MTRSLIFSTALVCVLSILIFSTFDSNAIEIDSQPSSPDSIQEVLEKQLNIVASRLITPNGDGVNDYWHIQGIAEYPDNRVVLYNRWGDMVFTIKNYDNETNRWIGVDEKNNMVPGGTYYYILEVTKERKIINGWVYLVN